MTEPSAFPTQDDPATLLNLLEQQRDLYAQLHELSDQQSRLIASGETEQLLNVLAQRQGLVESLTQINGRLTPWRDHWSEVAERLPAGDRDRLRRLLDEVQQYLQQILDRDEQDRAQLESTREQVGGQLKQVNRAGPARKAYGQTGGPATSRLTDSQG
jgi:flagellar biosynthesis/type III secretory pathway chaperone